MEQGLEGASDKNLKHLMQRYDQRIMYDLGYEVVKSGKEVVFYDLDLVNKLIKKYKKKHKRK